MVLQQPVFPPARVQPTPFSTTRSPPVKLAQRYELTACSRITSGRVLRCTPVCSGRHSCQPQTDIECFCARGPPLVPRSAQPQRCFRSKQGTIPGIRAERFRDTPWKNNWKNFGPRLGFAYTPRANSSLVVRGDSACSRRGRSARAPADSCRPVLSSRMPTSAATGLSIR